MLRRDYMHNQRKKNLNLGTFWDPIYCSAVMDGKSRALLYKDGKQTVADAEKYNRNWIKSFLRFSVIIICTKNEERA